MLGKATSAAFGFGGMGWDRIVIFCLYLATVLSLFWLLSPPVFLPTAIDPMAFLKILALVAGVGWFAFSFQRTKAALGGNRFVLTGLLVLLVTVLSSVLATPRWLSLAGRSLEEETTFFSLAVFFVLAALAGGVLNERRRIVAFFHLNFLVFGILFLLRALSIVGIWLWTSPFGLGQATDSPGAWNTWGLFCAWIFFGALVFVDEARLGRPARWGLGLLALAALIGAALVNFFWAWALLAVVLAGRLFLCLRRGGPAWLTLGALVIALLFLVAGRPGGLLGEATVFVQDRLGLTATEVRPSLAATFQIAVATLSERFWIGAGPNQFIYQWWRYRPSGVIAGPFWDSDFSTGASFLLEQVIALGFLGLLAWFLFLGFLGQGGIKVLFGGKGVSGASFLNQLVGWSALFWWLSLGVYHPAPAGLFFAFIFSGVLVALIIGQNSAGVVSSSHLPRPWSVRRGLPVLFFASALLAVGVIVSQGMAVIWREKAHAQEVAGETLAAEESWLRSVVWWPDDESYRRLATLALSRWVDQPEEPRFLADRTLSFAERAVALNPRDYQNHQTLARVYEVLGWRQTGGALAAARAAYQKALTQAPDHPILLVSWGRLEWEAEKRSAARVLWGRALAVRPHYPPALFLLGASYYEDDNFSAAAAFLQEAVNEEPAFSDALYFLGLSYDRLGDRERARESFRRLAEINPGHPEIRRILADLEADRPAL